MSRSPAFPRAVCAFTRVLLRGWHETQILTPSPVPRTGGGIIIANHISWLDPAVVVSLTPRPVIFMMAADVAKHPILSGFVRGMEIIPLTGSARDSAAMRQALQIIKDGHLLGIFPEGGIARQSTFLPFQPGAGLVVKRSGAPVYPLCVEGTHRGKAGFGVYLNPQKIRVAWGEALDLSAERDVGAITKRLESSIHDLHEEFLNRPLKI